MPKILLEWEYIVNILPIWPVDCKQNLISYYKKKITGQFIIIDYLTIVL